MVGGVVDGVVGTGEAVEEVFGLDGGGEVVVEPEAVLGFQLVCLWRGEVR